MNSTRLGMIFYLLMSIATITSVLAQSSNAAGQLTSALCGIIKGVRTIVGVLAICLFLVGGILYAVAHFLPTSVDLRKSMMSWATAMITGGIIGLIIVIIAAPLVNLIINFGTQVNAGVSGGISSPIGISC